MKRLFIISMLFLLVLFGCKKQSSNVTIIINNDIKTSFNTVADTIIYNVTINNLDKNDLWADERLKNTYYKKIIDTVFENAYNGELEVFDQFSNKKLTLDEIRKIESSEGYSRELINDLQFTEVWYMSTNAKHFHKEILYITIGYPVFDGYSGEQRGLKPVFKFKLKE